MNIDQKAYMIDQVVATDIPARRVVRQLFEAALEVVGGPLCFVAAQRIAKASKKGDSAFILTGFPIAPLNISETDGPPGAAVMAEALQAIGIKPVLITDDLCLKVVKAAVQETKTVTVPVEREQAQKQAERLFKEHNPSAVVAIERPGWNHKREYHNMRGLSISSIVGKTDYLFQSARRHGALTIGVGDGGNELGCGLIQDSVRNHVPYGTMCQCPCQGGIAAATDTDVLVIGGISNWAAYGISACLSLLKDQPYQHNKASELRLLRRFVKAGAVDSVSKESRLFVDGLSPDINGLVVDLIWAITNA